MVAKAHEWRWLLMGAVALAGSWGYALSRGPTKAGRQTAAFSTPVVANGSGTLSVGGPGEHVTVLEFFASWCGVCANAVPRAERAALGHGARWVAVSVDDSAEAAAAAARDWRLQGVVVHDQNHTLHHSYQISAVPSLVVLRADGSVSFSTAGTVSEVELGRRIEAARSPR